MIYLLIIIWRILVGIYYIIHDILYFLIYFEWLLFKPVYVSRSTNLPYRKFNLYINYNNSNKYKNVFYYLIKPIKRK